MWPSRFQHRGFFLEQEISRRYPSDEVYLEVGLGIRVRISFDGGVLIAVRFRLLTLS